MTWKILVADSIADEGIQALSSETEVDIRLGLKPEELAGIIGEYDALVVRSEARITAEVIEAGQKLQVIGRAGVGIDNIDLEAATSRGIVVVNAPAGNIVSAAEHTLALLFALTRHVPQACARLKSGEWNRKEFIGTELRNKTLGIIGLGRVGSEVARMVKGLEMRLIAYDPFVSEGQAQLLGVELVQFEELLKRSDFITIHVALTATTQEFIGARELALVKPTVRFINVARGGVIDEKALYTAIEEGRVAGAALDVFSEEPAVENILLKSDKVIATPHLGASTAEAQTTVAVDVAEQVLAVLKGRPARYAVNTPMMSPETALVLTPFLPVASTAGRLCTQLADGRTNTIVIKYEGEIADYDTSALKAAVLGGLLESVTDERVNLVNANFIAQSRGLNVIEQKNARCENYANLISVEVTTDIGITTVAGTLLRGKTHIVRINSYWIDIEPTGGYWLLSEHLDRPGLIGAVGMITGNADINISSMQVGRLALRGQALMMLAVDEQINEDVRQQLLAIPDVYTAKQVKL
ncbi:MAG: phosphoglycerate dehydrogenase [Chloroflexota bacterium]|nr:phosphoglycerate dehydrogenase [Chloroflexota bacterium]